jgi:hypothetical protein
MIVRRTRLVGAPAALWPDWRHSAFLTDQTGTPTHLDAFHRNHAVVELAIRDLKAAGLAHVPSGNFWANSAWLVAAAVAQNQHRWVELLGDPHPAGPGATPVITARSARVQLFAVPARLVNPAGRPVLRMPSAWPWAAPILQRLTNLRAIPAPTG